jgi:hypothetical protein
VKKVGTHLCVVGTEGKKPKKIEDTVGTFGTIMNPLRLSQTLSCVQRKDLLVHHHGKPYHTIVSP